MNIIELSVLKNRLSGILSVRHPSFSVGSGILSVVGIPPVPVPVPIPEEIQLLMYGYIIDKIKPNPSFVNSIKKHYICLK